MAVSFRSRQSTMLPAITRSGKTGESHGPTQMRPEEGYEEKLSAGQSSRPSTIGRFSPGSPFGTAREHTFTQAANLTRREHDLYYLKGVMRRFRATQVLALKEHPCGALRLAAGVFED
jgi:hypothetical protein